MKDYMLQIQDVVVVICCVYLNWISDQGKNLMWHRFYHGLSPSLCDALGFAMVELPEREQVNMSFDNLYTLTKKRQVSPNSHTGVGLVPPMLTEISIGDTPPHGTGSYP